MFIIIVAHENRKLNRNLGTLIEDILQRISQDFEQLNNIWFRLRSFFVQN